MKNETAVRETLKALGDAIAAARRNGDDEAARLMTQTFLELTRLAHVQRRQPRLRLIQGGKAHP